ncbi:hypothetical protein C8N46_102255 [Kordia periserrulae]|uniref:Uncharacterized protein n=1 Tax=Kordia periserrulae TaxID=701523 RepID=A0A2T6C3G1_9FLAO|nr:hypothetical protein [Kordia periserrulae]PTX62855.1 hypothetical protein C8N46_102255 [Kordia periserrulae]
MKNKELHSKKTGFSTPKDYFNSFEDRLFERMKTESVIPTETGFQTPDAYFDSLEDQLSEKLFTTNKTTKVIPLQRKRRYIHYLSYVAAACVVLLIAFHFFSGKDDLTIDNIANSEINSFIENDLIALNNYDVLTVYEEENVDVTSIFEVKLNETETIDYLENRADPYELLLEQ